MNHAVAVLLILGTLLVDVTVPLTYTSSSLAGEECLGGDGRLCPEECDNGRCTCADRLMIGEPSIMCLIDEYDVCSVKSDPKIHTFSNETLEYRIPCQYLLTGGTIFMVDDDGNRTGDVYNFKVYAYNRRSRGKFFPAGFRVDIERDVGSTTIFLSFRVDGRAENGVYTYNSSASTNGGATWFDFQGKTDDPLLNVDSYSLIYDHSYNRFFFTYPDIGFTIAFRAADDAYHVSEQVYLAGLVVGLKPAADMSYDARGLCFSPSLQSEHMLNLDLDQEAALMMLASTNSNTPQDFEGGSDECVDLAQPITTCSNNADWAFSINFCTKLFQGEKFVNCYSKSVPDGSAGSANSVLALFKTCIRNVCHNDYTNCLAMTQAININCSVEAPEGFSDYDCDSLIG